MYPINDRQYIATCSEIAKLLSVSLSSAKKKVEIQIAKKGSKTIEEKRQVARGRRRHRAHSSIRHTSAAAAAAAAAA